MVTYRYFFCVHVARFLLLPCHICTCTFVTGVCKLKRFIDFANISFRMSRFFSLFVTKKPINITRPSKKTPKQSISYYTLICSVLKFFFDFFSLLKTLNYMYVILKSFVRKKHYQFKMTILSRVKKQTSS